MKNKGDYTELPALDHIRPEHIAYVRSVVARFSVRPTYWRADLVQEVLIEAHQSRESRLDVRALLFGITRHVIWHWWLKCDNERATINLLQNAQDLLSAEERYQESERHAIIQQLIAELPDIFREVFVRAEIDEQPMPEIAAALGIPVNTGYTRLHLARRRFSEALDRWCRQHLKGEL